MREITSNVGKARAAADSTAGAATQTKTAGSELSRMAEQLSALVGRFKT
jgi:methyl-accepting chemotaxis protein